MFTWNFFACSIALAPKPEFCPCLFVSVWTLLRLFLNSLCYFRRFYPWLGWVAVDVNSSPQMSSLVLKHCLWNVPMNQGYIFNKVNVPDFAALFGRVTAFLCTWNHPDNFQSDYKLNKMAKVAYSCAWFSLGLKDVGHREKPRIWICFSVLNSIEISRKKNLA